MEEEKAIEQKQTEQKEPSPELIGRFVRELAGAVKQPKEPTALYANNTLFEVSAWDLKLYFGQLDLRPHKNDVDWHTAMTLPWTQARVLEYYLRANTVFYEKKFGPILMPPQTLPPIPIKPTEDQIKNDPQAVELWEAYKKIHEEMFGAK
jgi:hypothetical protein